MQFPPSPPPSHRPLRSEIAAGKQQVISEAQMKQGEGECEIRNGPLFHYRYKSISAIWLQKDTKTSYKYAGYMEYTNVYGYPDSDIKYL